MMNKLGCVFCFLVCAIAFSAQAQNGKLTAIPHELTVHSSSDFNVIIKVNAGGEPVSAADLYLTFDTTHLELVDLIRVDSPLNLNPIDPVIDNLNGSFRYSAFKMGKELPTELFSFIGVRFRAKKATNRTTITFPLTGHYKTLLAYAGENMLDEVRDINIQILPEKDQVDDGDDTKKSELNVNYLPETSTFSIGFMVSKSGVALLELQDGSGENSIVLFANIAHPEMDYQFTIDTDLMPSGHNTLELILNDETISKTLEW